MRSYRGWQLSCCLYIQSLSTIQNMFNHFEAGAILCNASCAVTLGGFIEPQTALFFGGVPCVPGSPWRRVASCCQGACHILTHRNGRRPSSNCRSACTFHRLKHRLKHRFHPKLGTALGTAWRILSMALLTGCIARRLRHMEQGPPCTLRIGANDPG